MEIEIQPSKWVMDKSLGLYDKQTALIAKTLKNKYDTADTTNQRGVTGRSVDRFASGLL